MADKSPRQIALENGEKHYFTGKPCVNGHLSKRNTSSRGCLTCDLDNSNKRKMLLTAEQAASRNAYMNSYNANRRVKQAEYGKEYYEKNKEKILNIKKEYRDSNKLKVSEKKKKYYEENKSKVLSQKREYRQANKDKVNALAKAYKVSKIRRLPKWIGKEEMWLIKEAYALAKLRTSIHGFSWHVDHVVPLQGELVSGLHIPENLQVIPWMENIKKKNKHTVV